MTGQNNIFDTLTKNEKFSTLTKTINEAGLADTLKVEGPFTLFAPTDEAFAKLPRHTLNELMKPEHRERLTDLLKYHVVPGRNDVKDLKALKTLQGQELKIGAGSTERSTRINDAQASTPGLLTKNGIVYSIDTVLMPRAAAATAR